MAAISSSTSQTATTLAQALAKLAADEAAKAAAKIIATDQAAVTQFENSQKPSSQNTAFDISV
jgi:predicted house-cleaning NTP pyrophosphatase (Maf/HAM1 superfamily)